MLAKNKASGYSLPFEKEVSRAEKAACRVEKAACCPARGCVWLPKQKAAEYGQPFVAVREGFEPSVPLRVRQFSKLVVSATHPPHLSTFVSLKGRQR